MKNYSNNRYTMAEVANYLKIPVGDLSIRQAKDANKQNCMLFDYWDGLKNNDGKQLKAICGYYRDNTCVYAEFEDSVGRIYSYSPYSNKSVKQQIYEDGFTSRISEITINGGRTVSNLTELNEESLKIFQDELQAFIDKVKQVCLKMESGINYCQTGMKDSQSQHILDDARRVINNIIDCIAPAVNTNEKILQLIQEFNDIDTF